MNYTIKEAVMDDLPKMAKLAASLVATQKLPFKVGGAVCVENFCSDFIRSSKGVCYVIMRSSDDTAVGWIGADLAYYPFSDEPIVQVRAWDIHPQLRGSGLGGQLLAKVVEWAKQRGVNIITVGVNKDSSDTPELAFNKLEKAGFKEFERTFYLKI